MAYKIKRHTYTQAKKLGVVVKPSRVKGKKYADERRRLYKIRHQNTRNKRGTPSYYADKLLW